MRHYPHLRMASQELTAEYLRSRDCVLIVTDHSAYDWAWIAQHAPLIVDTRNAMKDVVVPKGQDRVGLGFGERILDLDLGPAHTSAEIESPCMSRHWPCSATRVASMPLRPGMEAASGSSVASLTRRSTVPSFW